MAGFKLIIVESPTKAKTISQFVDKNYQVEPSYGHIRDLPKSKLGIDLENNFQPTYIIPLKSKKRLNQLKKKAAEAEKIILATDEDREGEAIAWHLTETLNLTKEKHSHQIERIVFHEITKQAIEEALKNPRGLNFNLINAQQARRILDRLVGYLLSPFLWKKITRGLSAGRVQSVALRLIVEREQEIKNFQPEAYWTILGIFEKENLKNQTLEARLTKINNQALEKLSLKKEDEVKEIVEDLKKAHFQIIQIQKKEIKKNPPPPFITSTLQQEAFKKLGFSSKTTMRLAQNLYEKGFITYMRTDSYHLSQASIKLARDWLENNLGKNYIPPKSNIFKNKSKLAQEAHEAIRPTQIELTPQKFKSENKLEEKLYKLIWQRFIACQMKPVIFSNTQIEIEGKSLNKNYLFKTSGNILIFEGFSKIWPITFEEKTLPEVKENENLKLRETKPEQHFTEPPPRYNEASLIKTLEKYGIGRPSTYAPIISIIQERNYVQKNEQKKFQPTEIGELVNKILVENFPEIFNIQFTAQMEEDLDKIAQGKKSWQEIIKNFYEPFSKKLEEKYQAVSKEDLIKEEETNEICDKCGRKMIIKTSRFGRFLACSGFPECKNTKSLPSTNQIKDENGQELKCPKCQKGNIIKRKTKKGRYFYGCSNYPECNFATWKLNTN